MSAEESQEESPEKSKDLTGLFEISTSETDMSQGFDPAAALPPSASDATAPGSPGAPAADDAEMPLIEASGFTQSDPHAPSSPSDGLPLTPPPASALENIRAYSEKIEVGHPEVEAAFPFSLLIEGPLNATERDKLTELITREGIGIRELDLDPQLEAGRVLIPRISEYAGVLIVQALRTSRAKMRLGPSESIYSTEHGADDDNLMHSAEPSNRASVYLANPSHPAESLTVTTESSLPDREIQSFVDAITASAHLRTGAIEAERSEEYQAVLEALQREIKYKAYRRGADAVVSFRVTLTPLSAPSRYRLTALGSAVKTSK